MKGKSLSSANVAASADLPAPGGPSSRHVSRGVCSDVRTCGCEENRGSRGGHEGGHEGELIGRLYLPRMSQKSAHSFTYNPYCAEGA
eukprot:1194821-Prorocentrum_minimum.AAC.2